jgi:hypothetical protein
LLPSFEYVTGAQVTFLKSTVNFHPLLLDLLCFGVRRKGFTNVKKLKEALPSYFSLSSIGRLTNSIVVTFKPNFILDQKILAAVISFRSRLDHSRFHLVT